METKDIAASLGVLPPEFKDDLIIRLHGRHAGDLSVFLEKE